MKKIIAVVCSVIFFCICLSGCSIKGSSAARTNDYLISALGFEEKGSKITVFAEAVIINTEDLSAEKKVEILAGTGKTVQSAFSDLQKMSVEVMEFSHCAVAILDENISADSFSQINDYLLNLEKLNLSVQLIACNNVESLLSCKAKTSIAVGYDIVSILKKESYITGIEYKNRLYETALEMQKALDIIALPSINVKHNEFFVDGLSILKQGKTTLKLNKEQSAIYAIATDSQGKGKFMLNEKEYNIKSNLTSGRIEKKNPTTVILTINLKTDKKTEEIKQAITELFLLSKSVKTDIFGIGNILEQKQPQIFDTVKKDYYEYYENTTLKVRIK